MYSGDMAKATEDKIKTLLTRGVEEVIKKDSLEKKLRTGRKLRVKHGVDPTTKDLHLGYAVAYWKLREFQEMGHQIVFLIGDFTARFGDPTDELKARKMRTKEQVREMAEDYLNQLGRILDIKKTEVRYNGEWYDKMSAEELLRLASHFTQAGMLERDMFQERIKQKQGIGLHEPIYPVLQAYDSVMLKSDLTVCSTDQIFNEMRARDLQQDFGQPPQDILATKLLIGLDGKRKMSQSLGNYIGLTEPPQEQYGKIMSIPDELILHYFELCARLSQKEIAEIQKEMDSGQMNPRDAKARLAGEITALYHGKAAAKKAEKEFDAIFKNKQLPSEMPEIIITNKIIPLLDLLVKTKLAPSKAEAKRLIEQGGVKIDNEIIRDWKAEIQIKDGMIAQAGKRRFIRIKF